jgi:iron complex outermembrane receptor protein
MTWSLTAYRHDWNRLRSGTAPPVIIENGIEGPVDGVEAWATWQVLPPWRLSGGTSTLRKRPRLEPGSTDPVGVRHSSLASDPTQQWMLRSAVTLRSSHEMDAVVRRVGALENPVPAYTAVDARYGWRVRPDLELSVGGQNLFDRRHPEFGALPRRSELERGVFVKATCSR